MKLANLGYRLGLSSAVAMLFGCGGSQLPVGSPGAIAQSHATTGYKTLYSFGKGFAGGQEPEAALIDVNGTLYGTTVAGGSTACIGGCGVVFTITSSGKENSALQVRGR